MSNFKEKFSWLKTSTAKTLCMIVFAVIFMAAGLTSLVALTNGKQGTVTVDGEQIVIDNTVDAASVAYFPTDWKDTLSSMSIDYSKITKIEFANSYTGGYTDKGYVDSDKKIAVGAQGNSIRFYSSSTIYGVADNNSYFSDCSALTSITFTNFNTSEMTSFYHLFSGCSSLTSLDLSGWDTTKVTTMYNMFGSCSKLSSITWPSTMNTSSLKNMSNMFSGCNEITKFSFTGSTSNVTDMSYMFCNTGFTTIDDRVFDTLDTSSVTNMSYMFKGCSKLTSFSVQSFVDSSVTNLRGMFDGCSRLETLYLSDWNTSSVTSMYELFSGCSSLTSLDLSSFKTSKVTTMYAMFEDCSSLTSLDLSSFNTTNVEVLYRMFTGCSSLKILNLSGWTVKSGSNLDLSSVTSLKTITLPTLTYMTLALPSSHKWYNTSNSYSVVTNPVPIYSSSSNSQYVNATIIKGAYFPTDWKDTLSSMSIDYSKITKIEFADSYTGGYTDKGYIDSDKIIAVGVQGNSIRFYSSPVIYGVAGDNSYFSGCSALTSITFTNFDFSEMTSFDSMFESCSKLSSITWPSTLNTRLVEGMYGVFSGCSSLTSLDLSGWNTQNLTYMDYMFYGCSSLTSLDLSGWNTSNVDGMFEMFDDCDSLETLNLSGWDLSENDNQQGWLDLSSVTSLRTITLPKTIDITLSLPSDYTWVNTSNSNSIVTNPVPVYSSSSTYSNAVIRVGYTVTITVNESGYGTVDAASVVVVSGTEIATNGSVLTIGDNTITATKTPDTAQYTYFFVGWTGVPSSKTVTENVTITAEFSQSVNTYFITIVAGDNIASVYGTGDTNGKSDTGTSATIKGYYGEKIYLYATLSSKTGYVINFKNWSVTSGDGEIVDATAQNGAYITITGAATVTANTEEILNTSTIKLGETTNIGKVYYGTSAGLITKELTTAGFEANANTTYYFRATANAGYTFSEWSGWFDDTTNPSSAHSFIENNQTYIVSVAATANELSFDDQTLIGGAYNTSYSATFTGASNGTGTYTYTISSVSCDGADVVANNSKYNGLSLDETTITGTPTQTGNYLFTILATDDNSGKTASAVISIQVSNATINGSVEIVGNVVYGETLTANATSTENATISSYIWYSNSNNTTTDGTQIGTGSTYKVGAGLVGQYIYVVVEMTKTGYDDLTVKTVATTAVAQKSITITADSQTIVYGSSIETGTSKVTSSALVDGDLLSEITLTPSTSDVTTNGTITPSVALIKNGDVDVTDNYSIEYINGTLTINQINPDLSLDKLSSTVVYGETDTFTISYSGDGELSVSSAEAEYVTASLSDKVVTVKTIKYAASKTVTITVSAAAGTTSSATSTTFSVTVAQKSITITADSQTIVYGSSIETGTSKVTSSALVDGDSLSEITLTPSTANVTTNGTITPSAALIKNGDVDVTDNYSIDYINGTLTITSIGMDFVVESYNGIYDGDVHYATIKMTTPTSATVEYGLVDGEYTNSLSATETAQTFELCGRTDVGTTKIFYRITADNYSITKGSTTITITKATLSTPTALTWSEADVGTATWNEVDVIGSVVAKYSVQLLKDGRVCGNAVTTDTNSYDFASAIREAGAGAYTFKVTATSDSDNANGSSQSVASNGLYAVAVSVENGTGVTGAYISTTETETYVVISGESISIGATVEVGYGNITWNSSSANATISGSQITLNANTNSADQITLTATAVANSFTVTFDAGEGTVSTESKEVTYGAEYGNLPTPTRDGYKFMGWFTDEEYTVEVTSTTTVTDTNNHTIYAKWEVETNAPVVEETDKKSIDGTTIALIVAGAIIVALAVVFLVVKIKKSKNASRKKHIVINSININKK